MLRAAPAAAWGVPGGTAGKAGDGSRLPLGQVEPDSGAFVSQHPLAGK